MSTDQLTMNIPRYPSNQLTMTGGEAQDTVLLRRIADGDEFALQELYALYGKRLYAYALRLTSDPSQAEDVLQDALVAVWHTAGRFRGEGRPLAWLLGIVHHTALKSMRHQTEMLSEDIEEKMLADDHLPEEQMWAAERSARLRRGLDMLSPEHRVVLELIFYQGLSLQEAARVCDCPLGTIKSRLSYARRYLRAALERLEEKDDETLS